MPTTPGIDITLPNPENIMLFNCIITPRDGLYQGAKFVFVVNIPLTYPYDPPKVTCETLVFCTPMSNSVYFSDSSFRFTILISTGKATFALVSYLILYPICTVFLFGTIFLFDSLDQIFCDRTGCLCSILDL